MSVYYFLLLALKAGEGVLNSKGDDMYLCIVFTCSVGAMGEDITDCR